MRAEGLHILWTVSQGYAMTTVKVSCGLDGQVELKGSDIVADLSDMRYRFYCPVCGSEVEKFMTNSILEILKSAGAFISDMGTFLFDLYDDETFYSELYRLPI